MSPWPRHQLGPAGTGSSPMLGHVGAEGQLRDSCLGVTSLPPFPGPGVLAWSLCHVSLTWSTAPWPHGCPARLPNYTEGQVVGMGPMPSPRTNPGPALTDHRAALDNMRQLRLVCQTGLITPNSPRHSQNPQRPHSGSTIRVPSTWQINPPHTEKIKKLN